MSFFKHSLSFYAPLIDTPIWNLAIRPSTRRLVARHFLQSGHPNYHFRTQPFSHRAEPPILFRPPCVFPAAANLSNLESICHTLFATVFFFRSEILAEHSDLVLSEGALKKKNYRKKKKIERTGYVIAQLREFAHTEPSRWRPTTSPFRRLAISRLSHLPHLQLQMDIALGALYPPT